MKKYIISTTGEKINFVLSGSRTIVIDTIVPVEVNELEFNLLQNRLGSQIQTVDFSSTSKEVSQEEIKKIKEEETEEKKDKVVSLKKSKSKTV